MFDTEYQQQNTHSREPKRRQTKNYFKNFFFGCRFSLSPQKKHTQKFRHKKWKIMLIFRVYHKHRDFPSFCKEQNDQVKEER